MTPPNSKAVPGYDGFYRVDIYGQVWSKRRRNPKEDWKRLKQSPNKYGYQSVYLSKDRQLRFFFVHSLVLLTFVGPCPLGFQTRHFPDHSPSNNRLSNLQWSSPKTNQKDRLINGTHLHGERNPRALLKWMEVRSIRKLYKTGKYTFVQLGKRFGVHADTVSNVVSGHTWKDPGSASKKEIGLLRKVAKL